MLLIASIACISLTALRNSRGPFDIHVFCVQDKKKNHYSEMLYDNYCATVPWERTLSC